MTLVKIYTLEDIEEANAVSTLAEGEHLIGRGATLNCNDKRVSRKHAVINVSKGGVTIKPVHVNPCFYKGVNGDNIIILAKDTSTVLVDGDHFALLADAFWFRVRVISNKGNEDIAKNGKTEFLKSIPNCNKETAVNEDRNGADTCSKSEVTTLNVPTDVNKTPSTSKRCFSEENSKEEDCKRQKTFDKNEQSEPNVNVSDKNICSDEDASSRPTSPVNAEPLLNTSQNVLNTTCTTQENLGENIDPGKLIKNLKTIIEEDYGNRGEKHKKDEEVTDGTNNIEVNNDAENNSVRIKQELPDESNKENQEKLPKSEAEKDNEGENNSLVQVKQEIPDESIKVKQEKLPDSEAEKDNKEGENSNLNNTQIKIKKEEKEEPTTQTNDDEQAAGGSSSTKNSQSDDASCSTDNQNKKPRRERCWYGLGCYRKNPAHRAQFRHPGDDDYDSDPDDDRPICPFGVACYRKNVEHRKQYLHLNPPAPRPNAGDGRPRKKRKTPKKKPPKANDSGDDQSNDDNSDDGTTRKKRKAATNKTYYDSPLDDYDYDDPFIDDASSDDFELSSDDDNDEDTTDWDDSQKVDEESQETRRLLKEAKKFTKAKGKKKD